MFTLRVNLNKYHNPVFMQLYVCNCTCRGFIKQIREKISFYSIFNSVLRETIGSVSDNNS